MATTVFPTTNDIGGGRLLSEENISSLVKLLLGQSFVNSGFTVPSSSADLTLDVAAGEAVIDGFRVNIDSVTTVTCTASQTNHIYLKLTTDVDGNVDGAEFEVNTTGTAPSQSLKIAEAAADGAAVTSTTDRRKRTPWEVQKPDLLTNGGFEIWQRGSGPYTGSGDYTADRWQQSLGSGSTISTSRDSGNSDDGSEYCAAVTYTHLNESGIFQRLENYQQLRNKTITFSLRVKTATSNAVRIAIKDDVGGYTYSSYHSGSGDYETLTVTATVTSSTTQLNAEIRLGATSTVYLDNAMLVLGDLPSEYAPRHPGDDMSLCERYYEVVGGVSGSYPQVGTMYASGANIYYVTFPWKTKKAVTPTVTKAGTWNVSNCNQPTPADPSVNGYKLSVEALAAGDFYAQPDSSDDLIIAEANP